MVISMKRDDVVSLRSRLGKITIRCAHGTVWVTVAGDSADYILSPGKELTVSKKGRIVVMAESGSKVHLSRPLSTGAVLAMNLSLIPRNESGQEIRSC